MKKLKVFLTIIFVLLIGSIIGYKYVYEDSTLQVVNSDTNLVHNFNNDDQCVDISFNYKFNAFSDDYEDLFQTAPANDGIRMEFANSSATGIGAVIVSCKEAPQIFTIDPIPTPQIWHSVKIQVIRNSLEVFIDEVLVGKQILSNPNFKIDEVTIGTGFSKGRPFSGQIENFNMRIYKMSPEINLLNVLAFQLVIVLLLGILFYYNKNYLKLNLESIKANYKRVLAAILSTLFTLGVIIYSTQQFLGEEKKLYYECLFVFFIILICLWYKVRLHNYAYVIVFAGILILLKSYFIRYSFFGTLSDLFLVITFAGTVQLLSLYLPHKLAKILQFILSGVGAIIIGFLTMGVLYIRYIQKVSTATTLFGEELQAIFQTNLNEAFEFFQAVFSKTQILEICFAMLVSAILCYFMFQEYQKGEKKAGAFLSVLFLLLIVATNKAGIAQSLAAPIMSLANGYEQSIAQIKQYQELRKDNNTLQANKTAKGETYVFVIGESVNKHHTSAYGYFRDTTPWMKSLRSDAHTIFLNNAYASFVHTIPSLLNALTSANQYNQQVNFTAPSIIEVAKKAGFKTYWFSNQHRYGLGDNPLTVIAEEADYVYFAPKAGLDVDGVLNGLLQDKLKNINPEDNNLIIIHLMGSHEKYSARLPREYAVDFKESGTEYFGNVAKDEEFIKNILNPYDASIKYTDENLKKMYVSLKQIVPDLSAYVYMPDHSEDVFGQKMHDSGRFNFEMTRIPFFMLFSDKWIQKYVSEYKELDLHKNDVFTTDLAFELLTGIMKIQTPAYDTKYDLGSGQYSINWANAITMRTNKSLQTQFYSKGKERNLSDDPDFIREQNVKWLNENNPTRFLAINCDTIGSAYQAINCGFNGIEINITVQQDSIKLGHGPEYILNMTLDEFLSKIPLDRIKKIWLDTKMEDAALINSAYEQLEYLDKKYDIKRKAILESSLVNDEMHIFADHGWNMTFYFQPRLNKLDINPPSLISKLAEYGGKIEYNPSKSEQIIINNYANSLSLAINKEKASNISFWGEAYPFIIKDVVPRLSKRVDFCSFAINNFPSVFDKNFRAKFYDLSDDTLKDKRVHSILIESGSTFYFSN